MRRPSTHLNALITLLAAVAACNNAAAGLAKPRRTPWSTATALKLGEDSVVRALLIMGHRLLLDSSFTLTNVQAILGKTTLVPPRDHDDFATECYAAADALGPLTLRLLSNELGGPEHVLLGFELTRGNVSKAQARSCASIGVLDEVKTDNGLYLGMSVASLLKIMGRPKRSDQGEYTFEFYEVQNRLTDPSGHTTEYETFASLKAKAAQGRVVSLSAWYTFASYAEKQGSVPGYLELPRIADGSGRTPP